MMARRRIRRIESLKVVDSRASVGKFLNWDKNIRTCACAANPLNVFFFHRACGVLYAHLGGSIPNGA